MDETFPRSTGPEAWHRGVRELVEAGARAMEAYRAAEVVVGDHRLQAALQQLRAGHERHVEELRSILAEVGAEEVARDGGDASDPLGTALTRGVGGAAVLDAIRRMELELREAYAYHASRATAEPIRAVLQRHGREQEAHVEWLHESAVLCGPHGDVSHAAD